MECGPFKLINVFTCALLSLCTYVDVAVGA